MIRALLLDSRSLLVKDGSLAPHVPQALEAMSQFELADGARLALGLVAAAEPTPTQAGSAGPDTAREAWAARLETLGVRRYFEPVDRGIIVVAANSDGSFGPADLQLAVQRLVPGATVDQAAFITVAGPKAPVSPALGIVTLYFGAPDNPRAQFSDWLQAPQLVAHLVAPTSERDLLLGLNAQLAETSHLRLVSVSTRSGDTILAQARLLAPVPYAGKGAADSVFVEVPVSAEIRLDPQGRLAGVEADQPSPDEVAELAHYVGTLQANQQIADGSGPLPPGATHRVEYDEKGRATLQRQRFSAV